jgi:hypothetical protein
MTTCTPRSIHSNTVHTWKIVPMSVCAPWTPATPLLVLARILAAVRTRHGIVRLIIIGINVAGVAGIVMSDPQVETAAVGGGMARELVNAAEVGAAIRVIAGIERDRRKRQDVPVFLVFGMELHERVREVCAHPFACWFASLSNLSSSVWR